MTPFYQRGTLLYQQYRYSLAADEFRKDLAQNPGSTQSLPMLALSLLYSGNQPAAIETAQSAISADPNRAYAYYVLAAAYIGAPSSSTPLLFLFKKPKYRRSLKKALPFALEAVRLNPQNVTYLSLLSAIELDLSHPAKSLDYANQALAIQPDHTRAANLRARSLFALGRLDEAKQTLAGNLAINPENAGTLGISGWTMLQSGEPEKALDQFHEALRVDPTDSYAQRGLSFARFSNLPVIRSLKSTPQPTRPHRLLYVISSITALIITQSLHSNQSFEIGPLLFAILFVAFVIFLYIFFTKRSRRRK